MYKRVLERIRRFVQEENYVLSSHARYEMIKDDLTIEDILHVLLNGRVLERHKRVEHL